MNTASLKVSKMAKEWLKDPEFKAEYDALEDEFNLATALIQARSLAAMTQEQVADEFSGMMLAGLDNDRAVHVSVGNSGCDYSTGETIAIVIGLILGIIPGLILMVLLC